MNENKFGQADKSRQMQDYDLMDRQARTLFVHTPNGRLAAVNEPGGGEAPLFFVSSAPGVRLLRFADSLSAAAERRIAHQLDREADPGAALRALGGGLRVRAVWSGPAYLIRTGPTFGSAAPLPRSVRVEAVHAGNAQALGAHFPRLRAAWSARLPMAMATLDGIAVSVCFAARRGEEAAEAGLETASAFRGQGLGPACTLAWAEQAQAEGLLPLYSTSHDNAASRRIAEKLRMRAYGTNFHVTGDWTGGWPG
ncbi:MULTISPECIES: GNAT family N-acetyltransferase [Saccharibacillus]|uniref:GNAT family N-acetyltransferase n=1 Tax=Saccharibacillus TaxID=456492 RepID=UPI0012393B1C|nr:GNAT family N-acetyltransferase [Saccharibacillus sp. WB 17]MWJ31645.1 GNAT family N-acetyltransferase [Saccharibacillus sp. WB 17]